MFKILILIVLTIISWATPIKAFTVEEAQVCADELLTAYNERRYPEKMIDAPAIVRRAIGSNYRLLTDQKQAVINRIASDLVRESFTKPSGRYHYSQVVVKKVREQKNGGYGVDGTLYIRSPKFSGPATFTVLVRNELCLIFQVRIHNFSVDTTLLELLAKHQETAKLIN